MRRMRGWIRRRIWWIVLIVFVGAGCLVYRTDDINPPPVFVDASGHRFPGYTLKGALAKPSTSDVAQVEKVLDAHAEAVLSGDRAGFLSGDDSGRAPFVRSQRTEWQNVQRLKLSRLSYTYDGVLDPDQAFARPAFLVHVTTTYQLKTYDSSPVVADDGFTFVQEDGAWELAGESDADAQFEDDTQPVPWDAGAIDVYGDGQYLAVVDRGKQALARRIIALCHRGSRDSRALLGVADTRPTVVLASSHPTGYARFTDLDALAVTYPLSGPDGVTPGWSVVVDPEDVEEVAASPVVLPHEVTHLATEDYIADVPKWLSEGAADYVAWHKYGGLRAEMRWHHVSGALGTALPSSASFHRPDTEDLGYVEGTAAVTWLEEHRGRGAVLSLMRAFDAEGGYDVDFDPDRATAGILEHTFAITPTALAGSAYAELNAGTRGS